MISSFGSKLRSIKIKKCGPIVDMSVEAGVSRQSAASLIVSDSWLLF